jgi:carbon starvation protein CstA
MSEKDLTALKNIVRVGTVSSVDAGTRTARVIFEDKAGIVSGPLRILKMAPIPDTGDFVLCVFLANGGGDDGFVMGGI